MLLALALAALASCASKPAQPAPAPEPAPAPAPAVVEPTPAPPAAPAIGQDELDKLLAQAQELKKKAFDLKLFEVIPDDYKAAEALYADGKQAYDAKDAAAAKDGLEKAVAAYKDVIDKGIKEIVAAKRNEAEVMRTAAGNVGASDAQPERYGAGAAAFDEAEALDADAKAEDAIAAFDRSRLYFELAWKREVASGIRQTIEEKGYAAWDSGNFQLAEAKYESEDGLWASEGDENRIAGADALDEAILRYNLVVQKGREMAAGAVKEKTDDAKQRSEEIKANVAVKPLYDAALQDYNEGSSQLAAKEYEAAAEAFDRSTAAFEEAYQAAADKRAQAEAAMSAADEATAESERKADEAQPLVQ